MSSTKALLFKDFRAHFGAGVVLALMTATFLTLAIWGFSRDENRTSMLTLYPAFLITFVLLSAAVLGKRLVVDEYQLHTHEFLQALPLRRGQAILLKYALGLASLFTMSFFLLGVLLPVASRTEPVGGLFPLFLALRSVGFLVFWWGLCFSVSLMGRFRPPLIWSLLILWIGGGIVADWNIFTTWPFRLVEPSVMPYQREEFPIRAFVYSTLLGIGLAGLGYGLATAQEGRLVSKLSGRLSQKEKASLGFLLLAAVVVIAVIEMKQPKAPYRFESEFVEVSSRVPLEILYHEPIHQTDAQKLLQWLEPKLTKLRDELKLSSLPTTRIVLSQEFDGLGREIELLEESDGSLIRCNFTATDFDRVEIGFLSVHLALERATLGRGSYDPNHWFLDGFSQWWVEEEPEERIQEGLWLLEDAPQSVESIQKWSQIIDRHGERLANSLAYTMIVFLERAAGRDAVLNLAQAHFSRSIRRDIRESLYQWTHPPFQVFEKATQLEFRKFFENWQAWITSESQLKIEKPDATFEYRDHQIICRLKFENDVPPGTTWTVLHTKFQPGGRHILESSLKREAQIWSTGEKLQSLTLEDEYSPGDLVWLGAEIKLPGLKRSLRTGSQRGVFIP